MSPPRRTIALAVAALSTAGVAACSGSASHAEKPTTAQPAAAPANTNTNTTTSPNTNTNTNTPSKPHITQSPIPFPQKRKNEMRRYAVRHYGINSYTLVHPHVVVEHFTDNESYSATWNTFAPDVPDVELHELPGVCSHFVIDKNGTIHQLVPLGLMCRHTVGLNYTAIGIEHVGMSDAEILHDHRQIAASLRLTRWLQARFGIATRNVIGHNESLSSPYHHENVASLRHQTHDDWKHADMQVYRRMLKAG